MPCALYVCRGDATSVLGAKHPSSRSARLIDLSILIDTRALRSTGFLVRFPRWEIQPLMPRALLFRAEP